MVDELDMSKGFGLMKELCNDCNKTITKDLQSPEWKKDVSILLRYLNKEKVFMREKARLPFIMKRITTYTYGACCDACKNELWVKGVNQ